MRLLCGIAAVPELSGLSAAKPSRAQKTSAPNPLPGAARRGLSTLEPSSPRGGEEIHGTMGMVGLAQGDFVHLTGTGRRLWSESLSQLLLLKLRRLPDRTPADLREY